MKYDLHLNIPWFRNNTPIFGILLQDKGSTMKQNTIHLRFNGDAYQFNGLTIRADHTEDEGKYLITEEYACLDIPNELGRFIIDSGNFDTAEELYMGAINALKKNCRKEISIDNKRFLFTPLFETNTFREALKEEDIKVWSQVDIQCQQEDFKGISLLPEHIRTIDLELTLMASKIEYILGEMMAVLNSYLTGNDPSNSFTKAS